MGYETEHWRQPTVEMDEIMLRSEHGRITHNVDYRSHWFILVKSGHHSYVVVVKHGGGEERVQLPRVNGDVVAKIICSLDSDEAYLLMHKLYDIHKDAANEARDKTAQKYKSAFVEGRLKKRKLPAQGVTKVWIEEAK